MSIILITCTDIFHTMPCHDLTWHDTMYRTFIRCVKWCDVIWYASTCLNCVKVLIINVIIFCIICIVLIFSLHSFHILPQLTLPYLILPFLILPYLILHYLILPYPVLSYLTLSYLTLSYLLWFNLAHFILFLSRFQLGLQMRIFMWIMTCYLFFIQP